MTNQHVRQKVSAVITLVLLVGATAFFFQNCSSEHSSSSSATSAGNKINFGSCSLTGYEELFSLTYAPFLQTNCASCHNTGGQAGDRHFASSNIPLAFDAFSQYGGFQRVSEYATNPSHKPPSTGTQHIDTINEITQLWQKGVEEIITCQNTKIEEFVDDPWAEIRIPFKSKAINPANTSGGEVTVRWSMDNDHLEPPAGVTLPVGGMPGAFFELTIRTVINGSTTHYRFYKPRLIYPTSPVTGAIDLHLESLRVKLNGEPVINETTFHFLNADARKNQNTYLSAGGMVSVGNIRSSDVVSISFGKIEKIDMPAPPAAPSAQFLTTAATVNESGTVTIPVQLSQTVDAFTTVGYAISGTALGPARYQPTGVPVPIPRWDSDYSLQFTGGSLVFEPGTTTRNLVFNIAADQRFENPETIIITLTGISVGFGTANLGANTTHTITISNDDTQPPSTEVTLSKLMVNGGAFESYCIRCHYPQENGEPANNYSMVTHADLLSRNRFVPGSPSTSTAWERITTSDLKKRMPADVALSSSDEPAYNAIYNWIMSGAKNN